MPTQVLPASHNADARDRAIEEAMDALRGRRRFIVMDVDSTLIDEEVIDMLGEEAGIGDEIAAITERAMNGELDFHQALHERVGLLKGLPVTVFDRILERTHFTNGALELIRRAHAMGWKVGVVSGGFHEIVDPLVERSGIDYALANRLGAHDGVLDGTTVGEIIDKDAKLHTLRDWVAREGLTMDDAIAIGDGANDIPMLGAAGVGIAFCAKPHVQAEASHTLNERDLTLVLGIVARADADAAKAGRA